MAGIGRMALTLLAALVGFMLPNILLGPWAGLVGSLATGWAVWAGAGSRNPIVKGAVLGAGWCGLIGFAGGFVGPMVFAPEANQGPLLGIFITGPAGVAIGAICGAAIAAGKPG